jgi:hypothetical protein
LLSVPRGAIPDKVVEETMKSWAASPNPSSLMTKDLLAYQKRGDLRKFMDALVLFLDKMDERTAGALLTVISSEVQTFSREGRERSEHDGAFKLALFILSERIKDSDRRERFEQTLRETPALEFSIRILNAVAQAQSGIYALQQAADLTAAREIVSQRVRQEVVDAGVDLIETNREWFILFQTGLYSEQSREMISGYALGLCEKNPSYIGKLVGGFRLDFGETGSFNLAELRRVYDSRVLAVLARAAGKTAWSTNNEQLAVEQLLAAEADPGPQTSDSSTSNS